MRSTQTRSGVDRIKHPTAASPQAFEFTSTSWSSMHSTTEVGGHHGEGVCGSRCFVSPGERGDDELTNGRFEGVKNVWSLKTNGQLKYTCQSFFIDFLPRVCDISEFRLKDTGWNYAKMLKIEAKLPIAQVARLSDYSWWTTAAFAESWCAKGQCMFLILATAGST